MRTILVILSALLWNNCLSQEYPSINEIEKSISDSSKNTFYPKLIDRFNNFDSTLTNIDFIFIYYGYGYHENYSGYREDPTTKYFALFNEKKFDEIMRLCDSTLTETPVCISSNLYKGKVLREQHPYSNDFKKYYERSFKLMDVLLNSGDGKSMETAYRVLFLNDEKRVMYGKLELSGYSQQALIKHYDMLTVKKSKKYKKKQIFFDVYLPLFGLSRQLKNETKSNTK